ncbi:flagellar biosynthesis protein FliQ [Plasticicumulans sp.]|uniref:flagellar biosynthesis protein FliQ n=1 Tax=Plasticicumulans sp. TaxID=2307179 RepID=UPI002C764950|nr:flagellar biosynthesis protein FliQ [Plasticicumulans sp.]MBS0600719.1 flagellar biosynthesis protein FliQ [Pseudomonadota bacterium]HMV39879.1 flagellar biosynthesis protein FliQ [Plasticicumulans sp.]HMW30217.1 flagellar biosynthesis protein FliQ [Plasticicumulans sp.]HMW42380.1 flagellar biosynthesis protein FliQ [Plasticicumulans sp.]HMZ11681.1 flagellar biosynthesis protein FliQ [Plasticicumulans sp.]
MTPETVITLGQRTLEVSALLSAPLLGAMLIVGLVVGLFQAATQINEQTLSFVPKLIVAVLVIVAGGGWMIEILTDFTERLYRSIPTLIG